MFKQKKSCCSKSNNKQKTRREEKYWGTVFEVLELGVFKGRPDVLLSSFVEIFHLGQIQSIFSTYIQNFLEFLIKIRILKYVSEQVEMQIVITDYLLLRTIYKLTW